MRNNVTITQTSTVTESESRVPSWARITHNWELVTPEIAKELIERTEANGYTNRKPKQKVVDNYARDMASGRWVESNPQPICISPEGNVNDGNHRLRAIIKSGKSITMLIARNVPDEAVPTIDIGSQRSVANALQFNGFNAPKEVASVVKYRMTLNLRSVQASHSLNRMGISKPEMFKEALQNSEDYKDATEYAKTVNTESGKALKVSEVGGLYLYLHKDLGWPEDYVKEFFNNLINAPRGGSVFNPYKVSMRELTDTSGQRREADRMRSYIKAWNAMVKGNSKRTNHDSEWFLEIRK